MAEKKSIKSFILRVEAETIDAIADWDADDMRSTNSQRQRSITEATHKAKRIKKKKQQEPKPEEL